MRPMLFVPVAAEHVRALQRGESLPDGPAYAATRTLRDGFGYASDADEDADYAAQVFASLRCLVEGSDRCVLAVEIDALPGEAGEADFGEVARPGVRWRDVRALFVDDPNSRARVRECAESVRGRSLAEVWADETAAGLAQEHDLLWFDPTELDQALAGLREDWMGETQAKGD